MTLTDHRSLDTMSTSDTGVRYCQCPLGVEADEFSESFICRKCLYFREPSTTGIAISTQTPPDKKLELGEKTVYITLKHVFQGANANVRRRKRIKKIIRRHQNDEGIRELLRNYGIDAVSEAAEGLLCQEIFKSTLNARNRFPELFTTLSPVQHIAGETAIIATKESDDHSHLMESLLQEIEVEESSGLDKHRELQKKGSGTETRVKAPSLFPIYLPFEAQHFLLVQLQRCLEHVCYAFGQQTMRGKLQERGWDCAEAVELNRWTDEFLRGYKTLNMQHTEQSGESLIKLFRSVAAIRHTAVHRIRTDSNGVTRFLRDAEDLARLLNNADLLPIITKLRQGVQDVTERLDQKKQTLQLHLDENLAKIAAERAKLDQLEKETINRTREDDKNYQNLVARELRERVEEAERAITRVISEKIETLSG